MKIVERRREEIKGRVMKRNPQRKSAKPLAASLTTLTTPLELVESNSPGCSSRWDMKLLTAIPVYNEERHLDKVLAEVRRYSPSILVVNDGSTDGTGEILARQENLAVITHPHNRGYGAALQSAFQFALGQDCDILVSMDCDGQHEPGRIPVLLEAIHDADIVSGSRYLRDFRQTTLPTPRDRQQ